MSAALEVEQHNEAPETGLLHRSFEATAVEVEGRTVDVRVVPFGEVARVADPPEWTPYSEEWLPGVFDHQLNAANRVHANYEHGEGITNVVGHGLALRSEQDGYHASFKIHQTDRGDTALELLRDGALPGVSLEARAVKSLRTAAGVVQRVKAHLVGIAFCRNPAFSGAQVLAIREAPEETVFDEELLPVQPDPELIERCRRLGIRLPQRYQAHPDDETDTSADVDTSESDGTRQTEDNANLSEET
jgi:HK97 family phage prohead protease